MELRGAAAIAATAAVFAFVAAIFGAATVWWLSRNPELEPRLRTARRLAWLSVALTLQVAVAVLVFAATGSFD